MKKIQTILSLLFAAIFVLGCVAEPQNPIENTSENNTSIRTKGEGPRDTHYYWYRGETIPLTVNLEYINILLSNPEMDNAGMEELCQEMHLQVITDFRDGGLVKVRLDERPNGLDEYDVRTRSIRKDPRIKGVYPYFERGGNAEPIGTSNIFYLKLNGEEGNYDTEPLQQFAEENKVKIVKEVPYMPDWYILSIEDSDFENSIDATNAFYESGLFADVDPAFMFNFQPCSVNDPYYGLYYMQWGLNNTTNPDYDINVESAWDISTGSGTKIAIVDGGIEFTHSDLSANIYSLSYNAMTGTIPSAQGDNHGTHVAGIAAAVANNNLFIAGVAYNSQLMGVSHDIIVSNTYSAELASGITWAWQNGADVINCSWGDNCGEDQELHELIIENAIINALTNGRNGYGSIVVFAAGNHAETVSVMNYPAIFDDRVLAVGAIDKYGYRASFSSYGPKLDVVAPGVNILSTTTENNIGYMSGTSMAVPHVSGVAALVLAANPNLSREEVVRIIEMTAKKITPNAPNSYTYYQAQNRYNGTWNQEVGYGLVDAAAAVSYAWYSNQTPPPGSLSLEYYVPTGGVPYNDGTIVIPGIYNYFPYCATGCFYIPDSYTNSAYTYFWHFSTSGDPYWYPSFNFVGNNSGVEMSIPRPSVNSVLSISCEVFNGPTHVFTAHRNFDIWNDFPS